MIETPFALTAVSGLSGFATVAGAGAVTSLLRSVDGRTAATLGRELREAGMDEDVLPNWLATIRLLAAAALAVTWIVMSLPLLGLTFAAIVLHAGPWWVRSRIRTTVEATVAQLPGAARSLAGAVRVGHALTDAFRDTAQETPNPLGRHLADCARSMQAGIETEVALAALGERVRIGPVVALASAVRIADQHGRVSDVLDRVAASADDTARLARKRQTDTASGRLMIAIMTVYPLGFLAFLAYAHSELLAALLSHPSGQLALCAVTVIVYAGVRWGSAILHRVGPGRTS